MAAAWILKKPAHIKTRLAAIAVRDGINVAPTAAASGKNLTLLLPASHTIAQSPGHWTHDDSD